MIAPTCVVVPNVVTLEHWPAGRYLLSRRRCPLSAWQCCCCDCCFGRMISRSAEHASCTVATTPVQSLYVSPIRTTA